MFKNDMPGDKIALYTLCKMYNRYCAVVTSAKLWCTLGSDVPLSEDYVLSTCNLWLLYIELGVFGELRPKPAMPPAPRETPILESATNILPVVGSDSSSPPLNLSLQPKDNKEDKPDNPENESREAQPFVTGNNTPVVTGTNSTTTANKYYPETGNVFADAPLCGCLDKIPVDLCLDTLLSTLLCNSTNDSTMELEMEEPMTNNDEIPEYPEFTSDLPTVTECSVKLQMLSNNEIHKWSGKNTGTSTKSTYNLRLHSKNECPCRLSHQAKLDKHYSFDSGFSSEEDFSVKPGKWSKPRV